MSPKFTLNLMIVKPEEERAREKEVHQEEVSRQCQRQEKEWITRQKMLEMELKEKSMEQQMEEQQKIKL